jgi:hypothetical protein
MTKLLLCAAMVLAFAGARVVSAAAAAADLPLVTDGRCDYSIVLPANATPAERRAGDELRAHLKQMSGAELPVISDDQPLPARAIVLGGKNRHLDTLGVKLDPDKLGEEGFVLHTVGERVVIAGTGRRGTMYAATTLLEKLGVRWLTPSITRVPKRSTVALPALDETQVPAFEYREPFFLEALDKDWAARLKINGQHAHLDDTTGGQVVYGAFVHTFDQLVPPGLFATHPEYFPLVKGKRVGGYTQRCLTNPDVLRMSVERVREWMRAAPDATIFSVSQNDTLSPCECDSCRAIEQKYGGQHSAVYLWFANEIGQAVEKEFPGKLIDTLAYQFTEAPPASGISPRPNVRVRLCPISVCEAHPYEQCSRGENVAFIKHLKGWASLSNELYVWHYSINFHHYLAPFPDERQVADSLRLYKRSGVRGVMFQGGYSSPGSNTAEMRSYLMAKLLWDPGADADTIVTDWLNGVYGKAAAPVRRWYDLLQARAARPDVHMFTGGTNWVDLFTPELLADGDKLFAEAEQLAAGDELAAKQLAKEKLGLRYARLVLHPTNGPELERFLEDVRAMGIGQLNEMTDVAGWAAQYRAKLR